MNILIDYVRNIVKYFISNIKQKKNTFQYMFAIKINFGILFFDTVIMKTEYIQNIRKKFEQLC